MALHAEETNAHHLFTRKSATKNVLPGVSVSVATLEMIKDGVFQLKSAQTHESLMWNTQNFVREINVVLRTNTSRRVIYA